ncbi:hypothetical protein [Streptomyces sp. ADI91-18]|uniref:hypothetical protein n=1 Tax=Streptomyces sp. ADI91-18 TaxID=1522755 RepID=UPI000F550EED|nr:hypothetical protein [Streptomyces sp. ADI91-18]
MAGGPARSIVRDARTTECCSRTAAASAGNTTEPLPVGERLILAASFEKDGEVSPGLATGILSLHHGDRKGGEGRIRTQPGRFTLARE